MSYNIDTWKMHSLHLELPRSFNFASWLSQQPERDAKGRENVGVRWCKEDNEIHLLINEAKQTWKLDLFNQSLSGTVVGNTLLVTELNWRGECSGPLYSDILLPLFKEFHGDLDAITVWEHGDTIEHLTIQNGEVSEEEIK